MRDGEDTDDAVRDGSGDQSNSYSNFDGCAAAFHKVLPGTSHGKVGLRLRQPLQSRNFMHGGSVSRPFGFGVHLSPSWVCVWSDVGAARSKLTKELEATSVSVNDTSGMDPGGAARVKVPN